MPNADSNSRKRVVLLGATGSIGENTLRVIEAHKDKLELVAIGGRENWKKLAAIALKHGVKDVAIYNEPAAREAIAAGAFPGGRVRSGASGLVELAELPGADIVLVAVVGIAGLAPALAALRLGRRVALASKEVLVVAGKFFMAEARRHAGALIPVDSEHNAVFQCLDGRSPDGVKRVVLTASGGAFRDWTAERLTKATPSDALKHPIWSMGPKITVDAATLANKGLELIEAQWLFGLRPEQCQAVIHPQSIVHCLVEFADGAMLAQLCPPSMTFPIQHALLYPARVTGTDPALDLTRAVGLEFRPVDEERFPMLRLAREAMVSGGIMPAVYNAANEVAVTAFLKGEIPFLAISAVVEQTLEDIENFEPATVESALSQDAEARRIAAGHLRTRACPI